MKVELYGNNTSKFLDDTLDILIENEAQNSLLISNAQRGKEKDRDTSSWFCATVKGGGNVIVSAMCTPPYNIAVYETGNKHDGEAAELLARELFNAGYILPGVTAEKITAELFSESYARLVQKDTRVHKTFNLMQLDKLSEINFTPGYIREITEDDLYYTPYWEKGFAEDCNLGNGDIAAIAEIHKKWVGKNELYVWIDKVPVSMAGNNRSMINGSTVGRVYTPPHYRNKGYCTSCVWYLSKIILEKGFKFASLFADADYPVSNKVYQKIGYRNVCLMQEIKFE